MSLLDPAPCIYAKTIVYELFSNNNVPKSLLGIYETVCWYSLFPVNSIQQKAKFQKILEKYNLDNITTNKVAELDKQYKSKYNTTFTKVIKKKLFPSNKGENKRKLVLKIIKNIEYQMEETSAER